MDQQFGHTGKLERVPLKTAPMTDKLTEIAVHSILGQQGNCLTGIALVRKCQIARDDCRGVKFTRSKANGQNAKLELVNGLNNTFSRGIKQLVNLGNIATLCEEGFMGLKRGAHLIRIHRANLTQLHRNIVGSKRDAAGFDIGQPIARRLPREATIDKHLTSAQIAIELAFDSKPTTFAINENVDPGQLQICKRILKFTGRIMPHNNGAPAIGVLACKQTQQL